VCGGCGFFVCVDLVPGSFLGLLCVLVLVDFGGAYRCVV